MPRTLSKCTACGTYTMRPPPCRACGGAETRLVYPPRFSVEDKYGKYRREMKRQISAGDQDAAP